MDDFTLDYDMSYDSYDALDEDYNWDLDEDRRDNLDYVQLSYRHYA